MQDSNHSLAEGVGRAVTRVLRLAGRYWKHVLVYQLVLFTALLCYLSFSSQDSLSPVSGLEKRWGGFEERPQTNKCYRQERTAMLLSLFFGTLGVDQFYARHWALAVFKLLTAGGVGLWAMIDMILWIVGGVYGTPGCPGGSGSWRY